MNQEEFIKEYERIMNTERGAKIVSAEFTKNHDGKLYEYKDNSIFTLITFLLKDMEPHVPYTISLRVTDKNDHDIWQGTPPPFSYNADTKENEEIPITLNLDFKSNFIKTFKVQAVLVRILGFNTPQTSGIVQDTTEIVFKAEVKK